MDKLWNIVKKLKRETLLDKSCSKRVKQLYTNGNIAFQTSKLENELKIKSPEQRFENMTAKDLQTAAEMFIYLNMCPDMYKNYLHLSVLKKQFMAWFTFYEELLKNKPPDIILLTLNRMMKRTNDNGFKGTFFKLISNSLKLKNEEIQSLLPGPERNTSLLVNLESIETLNSDGE